MTSGNQKRVPILFRCDGCIDPFTGLIEVRSVECEQQPEMEPVIKNRLQSLRRWKRTASKVYCSILLILLTALVAGAYGMLHNQLTYSIAPEYFTKIKFPAFGIDVDRIGGPRQGAACVGFISTWWVGALAALCLSLAGMIHPDRIMFSRTVRALGFMLAVAVLFGLLGWGIGELTVRLSDWAAAMEDRFEFPGKVLAVQIMHTSSYLGGLIGLIVGFIDIRRVGYIVKT